MTRFMLGIGTLLTLILVAGCGRKEADPRFQGTIVSHVDTYGSGTGNQSSLDRDGSMLSGFDYGDPTKRDWTSSIKWRFIRQDGEKDIYRVEWTFRPKAGAGQTQTTEASFDGKHSARVLENEWQTISIEPGPLQLPANTADADTAS